MNWIGYVRIGPGIYMEEVRNTTENLRAEIETQCVGNMGSQVSSICIVSDYELDDRGLIPDRGRGFFF
jgi:hypothetical protein